MLPKRPKRADTDTLIWEYLDGQASPTRLAQLSDRLRGRESDRQKLVDNAMLHGMLMAYFSQERGQTAVDPPAQAPDPATQESDCRPRRRRKRSAA
ncbi:MAG: hypothetical protein AAGC44_03315 [Planctomycetota bacterium]